MVAAGGLNGAVHVRWWPVILLLAMAIIAPLSQSSVLGFQSSEVTVQPLEDTNTILHNPDMGWVLYENYALDQNPQGSSTMLVLPNETFPETDAVALMFEWRDVETSEGVYDFARTDKAYEFWASKGKEIQLRISSEPLLVGPNGAAGAPQYVLDRLKDSEKQTRLCEHSPYTVADARNPFYRERLKRFLLAVHDHFDPHRRRVTVIDLRGFGLWGEWHSGFKYPDLQARRAALKGILDIWAEAFSDHRLLLSGSYDPDSPSAYYAGPNNRLDPVFTTNYDAFLSYSAFDLALKYKNIAFRRDGCGGAVHSNERRLNEEAFSRFKKGPFFSEFLGGFGSVKQAGTNWVNFMVGDALALHPNYINLLGWQSQDALAFIRERPDLIKKGAVEMGYRFVPLEISFPSTIRPNHVIKMNSTWANRGVGRALRDYELRYALMDSSGTIYPAKSSRTVSTSSWIKGQRYEVKDRVEFADAPGGKFYIGVSMRDPGSGRSIELPLGEKHGDFYVVGNVQE